MSAFRIYLPACESYDSEFGFESSCSLLSRYVETEFPGQDDHLQCHVHSVPRKFCDGPREEQAFLSEQISFQRLQELELPGLWCAFFHGRSYGGASFRSERNGKIIIREHDFVVFAKYKGRRQVVLIEVKSTCDDVNSAAARVSDARMIKNNKRSAQHQLRDHLEVISRELEKEQDCDGSIQSYIFWPFLSSRTKDPQHQEMRRWKEEGRLHVFKDTFQNQKAFNQWFLENVLEQRSDLSEQVWDKLMQRFLILSCGVFVDELHSGLLALLTQEQLEVLHRPPFQDGRPLIIHGAAGTGKTLLVLLKLKLLHQQGDLHEDARALFICYWPGIRCDVTQKLEKLGIDRFVDTVRFYIAMDDFLKKNQKKYKHVFMDESEAICLAFNPKIIKNTFERIESVRDNTADSPGCLWYLVDINQAAIFMPKQSPNVLKTPDAVLRKVMRSTKNIFHMFIQFYKDPFPLLPPALKQTAYDRIQDIEIGHEIWGPPVYWAKANQLEKSYEMVTKLVVDLCTTKGIKPNDLCVLPFFVTQDFLQDNINCEMSKYFVENGFMLQAMCNVENFLINRQSHHFLIPWVLRAKGLEFKVVILTVEDDDFDFADSEDRRKLYIMSSRSTCILILVASEYVKRSIDDENRMRDYPFNITF